MLEEGKYVYFAVWSKRTGDKSAKVPKNNLFLSLIDSWLPSISK